MGWGSGDLARWLARASRRLTIRLVGLDTGRFGEGLRYPGGVKLCPAIEVSLQ